MRCRIGNLAVVIDAYHRCNLGTTEAAFSPSRMPGTSVEANRPMTWSVG